MIDRSRITGVILAGGRATRMGSRDKGLESFRDAPLAAHALERLAPQVATTVISANRHLDAYAALGSRVVADTLAGYAGPLAGFAAVLEQCETDYLAAVPCDAPFFPLDLVATLGRALENGGGHTLAYVRTPLRTHPVFSLVSRTLAPSLVGFLADGGRAVRAWLATVDAIAVEFDDEAAFGNLNTIAELRQAEDRG
jgi:molybdopterin-guanine dinucleotide biosynthesis protein A